MKVLLALLASALVAVEGKNYYSIKGTAPKWHAFKPCSSNYFKAQQYCLLCPKGKFSSGGRVTSCQYKVRCSHLRCKYEGSDKETGRNGHTFCRKHGADGSRYTQGALGFGAASECPAAARSFGCGCCLGTAMEALLKYEFHLAPRFLAACHELCPH